MCSSVSYRLCYTVSPVEIASLLHHLQDCGGQELEAARVRKLVVSSLKEGQLHFLRLQLGQDLQGAHVIDRLVLHSVEDVDGAGDVDRIADVELVV